MEWIWTGVVVVVAFAYGRAHGRSLRRTHDADRESETQRIIDAIERGRKGGDSNGRK